MSTWRGDESGEPQPIASSLDAIARRLGIPSAGALGVMFDRWSEVVGDAAAAHSWPLRWGDGVLVVACDHGAWVESLRHLETTLLARLDALAGAGAVSTIELVVRPASTRPERP